MSIVSVRNTTGLDPLVIEVANNVADQLSRLSLTQGLNILLDSLVESAYANNVAQDELVKGVMARINKVYARSAKVTGKPN